MTPGGIHPTYGYRTSVPMPWPRPAADPGDTGPAHDDVELEWRVVDGMVHYRTLGGYTRTVPSRPTKPVQRVVARVWRNGRRHPVIMVEVICGICGKMRTVVRRDYVIESPTSGCGKHGNYRTTSHCTRCGEQGHSRRRCVADRQVA